jgi:hypothetical protein
MGFLKQMKDLKNTARSTRHDRPGAAARRPGAGPPDRDGHVPGVSTPHRHPGELDIAGISLDRTQLAKAVGRASSRASKRAFLVGNGHNAADWQAAYDG